METSGNILGVKSFVRGYHDSRVQNPKTGEETNLKREPQNKCENKCPFRHPNEFYSEHEEVVGHLPKLMALYMTKFFKRPTNYGKVTITGKRVNRGARYGLELPCEYQLMLWRHVFMSVAEEAFSERRIDCEQLHTKTKGTLIAVNT